MPILAQLLLVASAVPVLVVGWIVFRRGGFVASIAQWPPDWWRAMFAGLILVLTGALLIQLVPFGRDHSNPEILAEPTWDSARTEELARAACFDCHSNETEWPWYANVAPISWLLAGHVDEGRARLNFSEFGLGGRDRSDEAAGTVRSGWMPPWDYLLAHPNARLSESEQQELIDGLANTFGDRRR